MKLAMSSLCSMVLTTRKLYCPCYPTRHTNIRSNATHRSATFGHPVAGYAAMYYGYLYSKVFSVDMFRSVFQKDPMDGAQGRRYRKTVLEKGGSRPVMDSLKEFLGREPSSAAFYEYLGLAK